MKIRNRTYIENILSNSYIEIKIPKIYLTNETEKLFVKYCANGAIFNLIIILAVAIKNR